MAPSITDFPQTPTPFQPSVCRIGINGFGRIGRNVLRAAIARTNVQIVAINHTCNSVQDLIYLIRYDSSMGKLSDDIPIYTLSDTLISINGREIALTSERDLKKLNWDAVGADYVVECTGKFTKRDLAMDHIRYGKARRAVISAPSSDSPTLCVRRQLGSVRRRRRSRRDFLRQLPNQLHHSRVEGTAPGVWHCPGLPDDCSRSDSVTTSSPWVKQEESSTCVFDNIIPTSTGAAKAIANVLPDLTGKVTGVSIRVPTPNVSMIDLTISTEKPTSLAEILDAFRRAAKSELAGVLCVTDDELVSSDYHGNSHSAIADAPACAELNFQFFKIMAWYDNEWGYSNRLLDLTAHVAAQDQH